MAIFIHCPACNERLEKMRPDCPHCEAELPPGVLHALSMALGEPLAPTPMTAPERLPGHLTQLDYSSPKPQMDHPPPVQNSSLRPWLAAALSLFCGLGQLYNGQIVKGLVLIALGTASLISLQLPMGKFLVPIVWLYAIIDAYLVARRSNPHLRSPNTNRN